MPVVYGAVDRCHYGIRVDSNSSVIWIDCNHNGTTAWMVTSCCGGLFFGTGNDDDVLDVVAEWTDRSLRPSVYYSKLDYSHQTNDSNNIMTVSRIFRIVIKDIKLIN